MLLFAPCGCLSPHPAWCWLGGPFPPLHGRGAQVRCPLSPDPSSSWLDVQPKLLMEGWPHVGGFVVELGHRTLRSPQCSIVQAGNALHSPQHSGEAFLSLMKEPVGG